MVRLNMTVEGQTEQSFCVDVLAPYLAQREIYLTKPRLTALRRKKGLVHRGGLAKYRPMKNDIRFWLKEDEGPDVLFTTMMDMYGLPGDFPKLSEALALVDPYEKVRVLEEALRKDIGDPRFLAYIQLHEFETLLFTDPQRFSKVFEDRPQPVAQAAELDQQFASPEHIDDGASTHPSARILKLFPDYEKVIDGVQIASAIGIEGMRSRCSHFDSWLAGLESLAGEPQNRQT